MQDYTSSNLVLREARLQVTIFYKFQTSASPIDPLQIPLSRVHVSDRGTPTTIYWEVSVLILKASYLSHCRLPINLEPLYNVAISLGSVQYEEKLTTVDSVISSLKTNNVSIGAKNASISA